MEAATAVAGREDALAFGEALHAVDHFGFEGAAVVFVLGLLCALAGGWEEA